MPQQPTFTRAVLRPSSTQSVAFQASSWYLAITSLVFAPFTAFAFLWYTLPKHVTAKLFDNTDPHLIAASAALLMFYVIILQLSFGLILYPRQLRLNQAFKSLTTRYRRHRSHISRMRLDRLGRLYRMQVFTVFVLGVNNQSIPVLATNNTTINDIKHSLFVRGKIPFHMSYSVYTSRARFRPLLGSETLGSLGAGSLMHLHFRMHLLGGADSGSGRTQRTITASAKVIDPSNTAHALSSHQQAQKRAEEARRHAEAEKQRENQLSAPTPSSSNLSAPSSPSTSRPTSPGRRTADEARLSSSEPSSEDEGGPRPARPRNGKGRAVVDDDEVTDKRPPKKRSKQPIIVVDDAEEVDEDGIYQDISIASITPVTRERRAGKTRDVDAFFEASEAVRQPNGSFKNLRTCKKCLRSTIHITSDVTTCRRHIEANHADLYNAWCEENKFKSMLPKAAKAAREKVNQTSLDRHLKEIPKSERVTPYSDAAFREAAIEWLIATDQPIQAFEHPKFHNMIAIASRTTNGVTIPSRKMTHEEILDMFAICMDNLKTHLKSNLIRGEISLTCDAWQASNTDGYFAVTGHWIEEPRAGVWEPQSAVLGFIQLNNAHNGKRLGGALFMVVKRLEIQDRIGYITCDNASNNDTMMEWFARYIEQETGVPFDYEERRIRCLAHVINLATQAVIKSHSKSKFYDPSKPEDHIPETSGFIRDVVGLVRAICVKERSSAKRKELFKKVQRAVAAEKAEEQAKADAAAGRTPVPPKKFVPKQLLLDMPVRWSSTFCMLVRAVSLREAVGKFVWSMAAAETDSAKEEKLRALSLSNVEWNNVILFLQILDKADAAQQAFSSDNNPSLHLALPALEALHSAWTNYSKNTNYRDFIGPLNEGIEKITDYYNKTSSSNAFNFSMLLHPQMKMTHFETHWSEDDRRQIRKHAEETFTQRWKVLQDGSQASDPFQQKPGTGQPSRHLSSLLDVLGLDDTTGNTAKSAVSSQPANNTARPWLKEFNQYLDTVDQIPAGQTLIEWWAANAHRYPVWASLARDHLAIMASSVSSERAFSSAGITISKRRNRLKPDVVEALQCLKFMIKRDLFFRFNPSIAADEMQQEDATSELDLEAGDGKGKSWDEMWIVDDDDDADDEAVLRF